MIRFSDRTRRGLADAVLFPLAMGMLVFLILGLGSVLGFVS